MPHTFNRIWIHAVWTTKKRAEIILPEIENELYKFIGSQLKENGCIVGAVNGMPDHIHCLFILNHKKSVSEIMEQFKGSSSRYINQLAVLPNRFEWQVGYAAISVSESVLQKTFDYIKNQKRHHKQITLQNEFDRY